MKPYSVDLREKVVNTYQAGNISIRKLAVNFGVGKAFVQKMLKQYHIKRQRQWRVATAISPVIWIDR